MECRSGIQVGSAALGHHVKALWALQHYCVSAHSISSITGGLALWHESRRYVTSAAAPYHGREKQLLVAGLRAFQAWGLAAREHRRLLALRAEMFLEWRQLAATSERHWSCVLAAAQRRRWLLQATIATWRAASSDTAHL